MEMWPMTAEVLERIPTFWSQLEPFGALGGHSGALSSTRPSQSQESAAGLACASRDQRRSMRKLRQSNDAEWSNWLQLAEKWGPDGRRRCRFRQDWTWLGSTVALEKQTGGGVRTHLACDKTSSVQTCRQTPESLLPKTLTIPSAANWISTLALQNSAIERRRPRRCQSRIPAATEPHI